MRATQWDPGPSLRRHLRELSRERSPLGTPGELHRIEQYAGAVFRRAGLETGVEPIRAWNDRWNNVYGDFGSDPSAQLFIIGAHLDSVEGSPGADDNASGVAALLSLADWMGEHHEGAGPERASVTVRLAAFNLEEPGMVGSSHHARLLRRAGRDVAGMVSLEMLGYVSPDSPQKYPLGLGLGRRKTADFISVVGNGRSRRLVRQVARAFRVVDGLPVESVTIPTAFAWIIGAALSDHEAFWRRGYPAVMVGDTAFYRNPHYHRPSDTLETLSLPFLERVTRGLAILVESVL